MHLRFFGWGYKFFPDISHSECGNGERVFLTYFPLWLLTCLHLQPLSYNIHVCLPLNVDLLLFADPWIPIVSDLTSFNQQCELLDISNPMDEDGIVLSHWISLTFLINFFSDLYFSDCGPCVISPCLRMSTCCTFSLTSQDCIPSLPIKPFWRKHCKLGRSSYLSG